MFTEVLGEDGIYRPVQAVVREFNNIILYYYTLYLVGWKNINNV